MKNLRRFTWGLGAMTWFNVLLCGFSNLIAWEPAWIWSTYLWYFGTQAALLLSVTTLIAAFVEDDPAGKKACVLCGVIVIAVTLLMAVLMNCVFTTWFGFGELSGAC